MGLVGVKLGRVGVKLGLSWGQVRVKIAVLGEVGVLMGYDGQLDANFWQHVALAPDTNGLKCYFRF